MSSYSSVLIRWIIKKADDCNKAPSKGALFEWVAVFNCLSPQPADELLQPSEGFL